MTITAEIGEYYLLINMTRASAVLPSVTGGTVIASGNDNGVRWDGSSYYGVFELVKATSTTLTFSKTSYNYGYAVYKLNR